MNTTLYPGIAFSPQTVLSDNIGAADTIIPVADVSCFPEGPNLATIGTDETGETIFYAAKTADALSGCQRGVEGEARTWMAGEPVGRNFTAKDHNDLIDLLGQKQDKLDGKSGQVVGFNAEGKAVPQAPPVPPDAVTVPGGGEIEMAESLGEGPHTFEYTPEEDGSAVQASQVGYDSTESGLEAETVQGALDKLSAVKVDVERASNLNLLHNADFRKPINQRGQESYSGAIYGIDRWFCLFQENILQIDQTNKCIQLSGGVPVLCQKLNWIAPEDTIVTLSALYKGTLGLGYFGIDTVECPSSPNNWIVALFTYTIPAGTNLSRTHFPILGHNYNMAGETYIRAAKLELGPVQTLAHKEGDTWVLNDPPPDPALELAKCQRYYRRFDRIIANTGGISTAYISPYLNYPDMRAAPLFLCHGGIVDGGGLHINASIVRAEFTKNSGVIIQLNESFSGSGIVQFLDCSLSSDL